MIPPESAMPFRRNLPILLALALVIGGLASAYSEDSDAAYLLSDPVWYAFVAENSPTSGIIPHHPGFHLLHHGLTRLLLALGIQGPGSSALRLLSMLSWLLIAALALKGRTPRASLGVALFLLVVFSTRGAWLVTVTGENTLPAAAAAALFLHAIHERRLGVWGLGFLAALAVFMRQDNAFLVLPALILGRLRGRSFRELGLAFLVAAGACLAAYVLVWRIFGAQRSFLEWLLGFATHPNLAPSGFPGSSEVLDFLGSLGIAILGPVIDFGSNFAPVHALIGALLLLSLATSGALSAGVSPWKSPGTLALLAFVLVRIPFYAWAEPRNWEWWIVPLLLLPELSTRGGPGDPNLARPKLKGVLALPVLLAVILAHHARPTLSLRETRFHDDIAAALVFGGVVDGNASSTAVFSADYRVATALRRLRLPSEQLDVAASPERALHALDRALQGQKKSALLVFDRVLGAGAPGHGLAQNDILGPLLDGVIPRDSKDALFRRGKLIALRRRA